MSRITDSYIGPNTRYSEVDASEPREVIAAYRDRINGWYFDHYRDWQGGHDAFIVLVTAYTAIRQAAKPLYDLVDPALADDWRLADWRVALAIKPRKAFDSNLEIALLNILVLHSESWDAASIVPPPLSQYGHDSIPTVFTMQSNVNYYATRLRAYVNWIVNGVEMDNDMRVAIAGTGVIATTMDGVAVFDPLPLIKYGWEWFNGSLDDVLRTDDSRLISNVARVIMEQCRA